MTISTMTPAEEREARAIWEALPIAEAYPVGSRWTHLSYGANRFEVVRHTSDSRLIVTGLDGAEVGIESEWPRGALDNYGTPATPIPPAGSEAPEGPSEAPVEPYAPAVGDRVRVLRDEDSPEQDGKTATVLELGGFTPSHSIRVRYDEGEATHTSRHGWWVREVEAYVPTTPEEFKAEVEHMVSLRLATVEEDKAEAVRVARREVREETSRAFEEWKRSANDTAIRYADNNSLCSEFDRCMIEIGMEPRESFTRSWVVSVSYNVYVEARDEESAEEEAFSQISNGYVSPDNTEVEEN